MHFFLATMPRKFKILIMLLGDIILLPLALWSAIALRYGTFKPEVSGYWWLFLLIPFLTVPIFIRLGLYRAVIRYLDEQIIKTVFFGVTLSVLILVTVIAMAQIQGLPRTSIVIYWIISSGYIITSRYLARGILRTLERKERRKQKVAIYGAGRAGLQTALALMSGPEFKPVLFFDDDPDLHWTTVAGIRVHDPKDAIDLMDEHSCFQLLLALPSISRSRRKEILRQFEGKNIQLRTIPGLGEIVAGSVKIDDIREVGVEDLLGRDPVPPFEDLISSCIQKKVVLVTGAGGSIGAELCRQILKNNPQKIILFERSEFALYSLERELAAIYGDDRIICVLDDVLNQDFLAQILTLHKVETVYHAAAYKHVPLVERNIISGVMNNVFGTLFAAQASCQANVEKFVLVSTDKAVRPTNVMGATKRFAELILQALAKQQSGTKFCMVRFGNVLGSSGSVIPLFKEQIRLGGPITVTHPDVTRYFMTIPEAAQLVLQAGALGDSGEVFVLDMGEPVRIVDLAKKMIELSGFEVNEGGGGDIEIQYVGLRPGEKLYEELLIGDNVQKTKHPRIMKADEDFIPYEQLIVLLAKIKNNCSNNEPALVLNNLKEIVKEYL